MSNPLSNYLHDHLAGASHAVALLEGMREQHREDGNELGGFAASLLADIRLDCDELIRLAAQAGGNEQIIAQLRDALCSRVLPPLEASPFALRTMESLDLIALGLHGRWVFWQVLDSLSRADARLKGTDFKKFAARAGQQEERVNAFRRHLQQRAMQDIENT